MTLADIRPSFASMITFFLMWVFISNVSKFFFVKTLHINGLSQLVANA